MVAGVVLGQVASGLVPHCGRRSSVKTAILICRSPCHLADDRTDDDEGRFRLDPLRRGTPDRTRHYAVRQLGGQTVFDGVHRVAVLPRRFCLVDHAGRIRSAHRRGDHPGPSPLHSDGVCLELSDGRGSSIYVGPGVRKQFDHARVICADCRPTGERRLVVVRSLYVLLYLLLAFIVIPLAIGWGASGLAPAAIGSAVC